MMKSARHQEKPRQFHVTGISDDGCYSMRADGLWFWKHQKGDREQLIAIARRDPVAFRRHVEFWPSWIEAALQEGERQ